jgi:hypothetical protein
MKEAAMRKPRSAWAWLLIVLMVLAGCGGGGNPGSGTSPPGEDTGGIPIPPPDNDPVQPLPNAGILGWWEAEEQSPGQRTIALTFNHDGSFTETVVEGGQLSAKNTGQFTADETRITFIMPGEDALSGSYEVDSNGSLRISFEDGSERHLTRSAKDFKEEKMAGAYNLIGLLSDGALYQSELMNTDFDPAGGYYMRVLGITSTSTGSLFKQGSGQYEIVDETGIGSLEGNLLVLFFTDHAGDTLVYGGNEWPHFGVGTRSSETQAPFDRLNGDFHLARLTLHKDAQPAATFGQIRFAAGHNGYELLERGAPGEFFWLDSGNYEVSQNTGQTDQFLISLTTPDLTQWTGSLNRSSDILTAINLTDRDRQGVFFAIQAGEDFAQESLNGIYYQSEYFRDNGGVASAISSLVFDGEGKFVMQKLFNRQAERDDTFWEGGSYQVHPDGTFTLIHEGEEWTGAISADRQSFIAIKNGDAEKSISFGVKNR